ncbi:two-component sensor histidine kinase [Streptosporangium nondiastaticum]|uniref:Signal transduction histidine-protein kinase/phosphatase MprB n=1 Tax=Streptosporangium nondiastaticum TaxID=35764 RepID=A0A9X7JVA3_9ACTN|nr:HAMP domain-containing sensor histidine kinase [Streptosporangium nondiastaticum]PSJ30440.1 two-component sensor histidine kinase [Streptosporangium nondiastaticum]
MTAFPRALWPRTLRGRLSLVALATATLVMVVLTVLFNVVARTHLQRQADDELRTRAEAVATTVDTDHDPVRVRETADDALLDTNVWIYAGPHLLEHPASTPPDGALAKAAARLAAHSDRRCATVEGNGSLRLCSRPVKDLDPHAAPRAVVVTALDLSPYRASADTMLLASLALGTAVLACTYVLTRLAVGRALHPVRIMTDQATRWSAVASDERFGYTRRPDELARLGASLDALLDRIRAVLRHEQQLTAELSHELRNPLARITAELDWWQARPRSAEETRATHAGLADAAQCMRTICDTLLDDARDSARAIPGTTAVLPTLRHLTAAAPADSTVTVTVSCPQTLTAGVDAALLERIISPLLDNALRYARSHVLLRAGQLPDGSVRVEIADDGPGVPDSFGDQIFQPGRRADPGDGHRGAGLGLPLARRLARSVGGDVCHDARHEPGAAFLVSLPSA